MARPRKHRTGLPSYCYRRKAASGWRYIMHVPDPEHAGRLISRGYGDDLARMLDDWARVWGHVSDYQTLGEVMTLYANREIPKKSPATQHDYAKHIAKLRPVFGAMRPDALTPVHIFQWQDVRGAQSVVQCNREKAVLSGIMQLALRLGVAKNNPARQVPKLTETPRDRDVTLDEFEAVYRLAPPVIQMAMRLAVITGLRQGDLLALRRDQITPEGVLITQGKTGKRILIERTPDLTDALRDALQLRRVRSFHVICTEHGQPYTGSGFRSIWQRVMRAAVDAKVIKTRYTFHDLRAVAGDEAPDWRLLGHSDEATFRRHYKRRPVKVQPAPWRAPSKA